MIADIHDELEFLRTQNKQLNNQVKDLEKRLEEKLVENFRLREKIDTQDELEELEELDK